MKFLSFFVWFAFFYLVMGKDFKKLKNKVSMVKNLLAGECVGEEDFPDRFILTYEIPETKPEKCFLRCYYKSFYLISEDEKFNPKAVVALTEVIGTLGEERKILKNILSECSEKINSKEYDPESCEIGVAIRMCVIAYAKKIGFRPPV